MRTHPNGAAPSAAPHQGVEDGEQLPHARHQRHLQSAPPGEDVLQSKPLRFAFLYPIPCPGPFNRG